MNNNPVYMMATIEGIDIYYHEAVWVLNSGNPIPENKLVAHKDGNTMNNTYDNLELVDSFEDHSDNQSKDQSNDQSKDRQKLFHENNYKDYKYYIEANFRDIYDRIFQ